LENDKNKLETDFNVDNSERREIFQNAKDLAESLIDEARVEMNLVPETEEGKQKVREIIKDNVRMGFEIPIVGKKNWELLALSPYQYIAGIITTVVVAGKGAVAATGKRLGAVGKALARLAKNALPILVPLINMLSTILSWGAKGLAFLAQNLWILAVVIAGIIIRYLQNKRKRLHK
jgi:hypothetical protein